MAPFLKLFFKNIIDFIISSLYLFFLGLIKYPIIEKVLSHLALVAGIWNTLRATFDKIGHYSFILNQNYNISSISFFSYYANKL